MSTLGADILRVMPSKAIELAAFDAYKKLLSREDEEGRLMRPGPLLTGLAGAAAGALPCLMCPDGTPALGCSHTWHCHMLCY